MKKHPLIIALLILAGIAGTALAMEINGQLKNAYLEKLASDPATCGEARAYYNTTSDKAKYCANGSWLTIADTASALSNPMDSEGDLIYGGASGAATKLDAGSSGQLLVSGGAGAPSWTDAISGRKTFTGSDASYTYLAADGVAVQTLSDGRPFISMHGSNTATTATSIFGMVSPANDTGAQAVVRIDGRRNDGNALTTRPPLEIHNGGTAVVRVTVGGELQILTSSTGDLYVAGGDIQLNDLRLFRVSSNSAVGNTTCAGAGGVCIACQDSGSTGAAIACSAAAGGTRRCICMDF